MTARPEYRSRARTRTGIRPARRITPCYRHPDEPVTGICASCLRERLSGLDSAVADVPGALSTELRRCRSVVAIPDCEGSSSSRNEPRRKSCDVVSARSSLCNLFDADDLMSGSGSEAIVESRNVGKNVGLSNVTYTVIEPEKNNLDEIRVSSHKSAELNADDGEGDIQEGEFKTMKEHIDLEFQNKTKKSKDLRDKITANLFGAASVITRKLFNWRQNTKNQKNHINGGRTSEDARNPDILRRRSCDTDHPRFSVDAGKIPFEEPRASWDGYLIARTIPRLAPMFSMVENNICGGTTTKFESHRLSMDGPMRSIVEDESSSGHSNSESSSSMRRSSFDRSSSVQSFGKKPLCSENHENVKLVITEKELKDWHLNDGLEKVRPALVNRNTNAENVEDAHNSNGPPKKTIGWRKVCNVLGFGPKSSGGNVVGSSFYDIREMKGKGDNGPPRDSVPRLARSTSVAGPRKSCDAVEWNYRRRSLDGSCGNGSKGIGDFKVERDTSGNNRYLLGDGVDGLKPFYMTPLRSLKHSKSGKFKLQNFHGPSVNVLRLN